MLREDLGDASAARLAPNILGITGTIGRSGGLRRYVSVGSKLPPARWLLSRVAASPSTERDGTISISRHTTAPWQRGQVVCYLIVALVAGLGLNILAVSAGGAVVLASVSLSTAATIAILATATYYFTVVRVRPNFAVGAGAAMATCCGMLLAVEAGYAVHFAGRGFPLVDPWLSAADRAMGIDWLATLRWFDGHPLLTNVLRVAYERCWLLTLASVIILSVTGNHRRLFIVTAAELIALTLVHLIALVAPAIGAYGYYRLSPAFHPHVVLTSTDHSVAHVLSIRAAGTLVLPRATAMLGIVTFPSFHTVYAIQRGWALWAVPGVRWIGVCFSLAIVISTVPQGSHHVIDVICGVAVALLTILLTSYVAKYVVGRWANAVEALIARK